MSPAGLEDTRPEWVKRAVFDIHFLHFGCILFLIVIVATVVISLCTEPIPEQCVSLAMNSVNVQ